MLIELPTADEIDDLAITTPKLEVRKIELDFEGKADLNYAPCKGQIILAVRGAEGLALVRQHGDKGWSLPSDRISSHEDIGKSARRVAKEQCGLMLRSIELAGIYDVIWHFTDVSIKRLHFVYAAHTDDGECSPSRHKEVSEARFFREIPEDIKKDKICSYALADCSQKQF